MTTPSDIARTARLDAPFHQLIGGELVAGRDFMDVINPATAKPFAQSPKAGRAQLDRAVSSATQAFDTWRRTSFDERRRVVLAMAARLLEVKDELATLLVLEQGKPLAAALAEIDRAAAFMHEICGIEIAPEIVHDSPNVRSVLSYKPLGVIGAVTPWNMPLVLAAPKIASALYAGNCIILKPSPFTPLATLRMGEYLADIAPGGVLNVLAGDNALGEWMSAHPGIQKINFTGSIETGRRVMASAAPTLKRLTLELGGNDAAIVLDDADLDVAAPKLFWAAFGLAGQICMAVKRLFVPQAHYAEMVARLTELAQRVRVGDGFEPGVEMGPIQNRLQYDKVVNLIEDTRLQAGAHFTTGGHALNRPGYFLAPAIVTGVREGCRLVDEEPFGPILPVLSYADLDEAVQRANATSFGLGGSVWTRDETRGTEVASRLDAGFTWVNHHVGTTRDLPFGGVKKSGIGRQGHKIGVTSDMEAQVVQMRR